MKRFRQGFVCEAHRLVYHSTLGLRVIKKENFWLRVPAFVRRTVRVQCVHTKCVHNKSMYLTRTAYASGLGVFAFRKPRLGASPLVPCTWHVRRTVMVACQVHGTRGDAATFVWSLITNQKPSMEVESVGLLGRFGEVTPQRLCFSKTNLR